MYHENNFFKIKKIEAIGNIDQKLNSDISLSLEKFYNINIWSILYNVPLFNFNILSASSKNLALSQYNWWIKSWK